MIRIQAYEIVDDSELTIMALLSRIPAGEPLEIESSLERIDLNQLLTRNSKASLLLRINGDSMEDVPIFSGDYVMLDRTRQPEIGQIVVARLNGGYTIKKFKFEDKHDGRCLYLVPANPNVKTKTVTIKDEFEIIGVVIWIMHPTI